MSVADAGMMGSPPDKLAVACKSSSVSAWTNIPTAPIALRRFRCVTSHCLDRGSEPIKKNGRANGCLCDRASTAIAPAPDSGRASESATGLECLRRQVWDHASTDDSLIARCLRVSPGTVRAAGYGHCHGSPSPPPIRTMGARSLLPVRYYSLYM